MRRCGARLAAPARRRDPGCPGRCRRCSSDSRRRSHGHRRRRPGRADGGLRAGPARSRRGRLRGRRPWSGASRAPSSSSGCRLDIGGHRFFTKVPEVERLWHEILGDDLLVRPQDVPHLLRREVLRLSAAARERAAGPGCRRSGARAGELRPRAAVSRRRRTHVRRLGEQPVRPAPLRDLLQDLHREGLGHAVLGDQRGVGRPADQEPRPDDRAQECVARQRGRSAARWSPASSNASTTRVSAPA